MTLLVTGGRGFIGWRVVRTLLQRQVPVVVGDWQADAAITGKLPGAEFVALDVSDENSLRAVFERHPDISQAIHLAYLMSAEFEANPRLAPTSNCLGLINLF